MNSNSIVLEDIDDYLAPSQACINPLFQPSAAKEPEKKPADGAVVVPRRRRRRPLSTTSKTTLPAVIPSKKKEVVKASIVDCLACSGCVTTAETVLLEQRHSLDSLHKRLQANNDSMRAITLSSNSWADMRRHWNLDSIEASHCQFTTLLNLMLNAILVADGNLPLLWTWLDEAQEFVESYKDQNGKTASAAKPLPSVAVDAEKTIYYQPDGTTQTVLNSTDYMRKTATPLISGSCPALVCLVEKNMNELVPNLSQSQSPMSRFGSLLKHSEKKWDHWAIMPCHDKKLEASRQDFVDSEKQHGVDLVITTNECIELVEEWIQSTCKDTPTSVASYLQSLDNALQMELVKPDDLAGIAIIQPTFLTTPASSLSPSESDQLLAPDRMAFSSGGHADFIFQYAAKEIFNCELQKVEWKASTLTSSKAIKSARLAKAQKNHYYKAQLFRQADGSCTQTLPDDELANPVLEFAIAHGMQTMQRALKELSSNNTNIDYMEAMACPFGCVNGGGAVKTSAGRETPTETRGRVQSTLTQLKLPLQKTEDLCTLVPLRTRFHAVPPMQHTIGAAAGVKVDDIQW